MRNNWQIQRTKLFLSCFPESSQNKVIFQTIHGSKGLEYDTVILAGIEDGVFPSCCSEIEEERRLLYVAITRAKNHLHILYRTAEEQIPLFAKECRSALLFPGPWRVRLSS